MEAIRYYLPFSARFPDYNNVVRVQGVKRRTTPIVYTTGPESSDDDAQINHVIPTISVASSSAGNTNATSVNANNLPKTGAPELNTTQAIIIDKQGNKTYHFLDGKVVREQKVDTITKESEQRIIDDIEKSTKETSMTINVILIAGIIVAFSLLR